MHYNLNLNDAKFQSKNNNGNADSNNSSNVNKT